MNKIYKYILLLIICLLYSNEGIDFSEENTIRNDVISIIATANVKGETDPCGWKKKPLGGLARKATILTGYNANEFNNNTFVVDAGDLFFSKKVLEPGISKEVAFINADIILNSFNKMGCTAFSPGPKDFAAGKAFIIQKKEEANFPFISSNIYDKESNQLLFKPYVIESSGGKKIAFIGLSSEFHTEGIEVKNPIESLKSILEEVIPISDIRILLFNSNDNDNKIIKREFINDLALIIRSSYKARSFDGGPDTPTYGIGEKGKLLYKFELDAKDASLPYTDIAWCTKTIEDKTKRLDNMKKGDMLVDLRVFFKDNPIQLAKVIRFENQIEEANQRLENAINKITFEKIELSKQISSRIDILQIIDEGKFKIKELTKLHPDYNSEGEKIKPHAHDHDGDGIPDH